jgi:hypothetical protein
MAMICEWFGLKTTHTVFTDLASKPVAMVSGDLISKFAVTVSPSFTPKPWWVSWLSLKTNVVEGFSVWTSKSTASIW